MTLRGHRVLLTNDDGIHAPGIEILERIVRKHTNDVWVVAPAEERSGASHAISMHDPIRLRQLDDRHFSIKGSPTDCALMGIYEIMPAPPTLLLSGINWGANLAEDMMYSGTAAAAMEGALLGVPSIALSQVHAFTHVYWDTAEAYLERVIEGILATEFEKNTFVNVNFPPVAPEDVKGIRVVDMGLRPPGSFKPEGRIDARTKPYYWIKIQYKDGADGNAGPGTDLRAIADREISVTPVKLDWTAPTFKDRLAGAFACFSP